jgi:hypothetical protein
MKTARSRVAKCADTRFLFRIAMALMNAEKKPTQKDEELIRRPARIYTFYGQ